MLNSAMASGMPSPAKPGPLPQATCASPDATSSFRILWLCQAARYSVLPSGDSWMSVG